MQQAFQVANVPTTALILAEMVNYLQSLQQRQRWQRTSPNLQPGDLVLLKEDNTSPLHWPTAVITQTHPGKNNSVRVVTLRTPKGTFKHPITKINPFPPVNRE
jgi:hypothetical protein